MAITSWSSRLDVLIRPVADEFGSVMESLGHEHPQVPTRARTTPTRVSIRHRGWANENFIKPSFVVWGERLSEVFLLNHRADHKLRESP